MKDIKPIEEAAKALKAAMDRYNDLSAEASLARSRATDALNDLNRAQSTFDEVIAGLRADQHPDSDWAREKIKRIAVSANAVLSRVADCGLSETRDADTATSA